MEAVWEGNNISYAPLSSYPRLTSIGMVPFYGRKIVSVLHQIYAAAL